MFTADQTPLGLRSYVESCVHAAGLRMSIVDSKNTILSK